jgi:hypothetical protein
MLGSAAALTGFAAIHLEVPHEKAKFPRHRANEELRSHRVVRGQAMPHYRVYVLDEHNLLTAVVNFAPQTTVRR